MELIIIAAMTRDRVIGRYGSIPWNVPEELQHFKSTTIGTAVLMGHTTFRSLPAPLPQRRNIVLASQPIAGVESYSSVTEALHAVKNEKAVYIIGGGAVFSQTLEIAHRWVFSIIDGTYEGDTYFPPYEHLLQSKFQRISTRRLEGFTIEEFQRVD